MENQTETVNATANTTEHTTVKTSQTKSDQLEERLIDFAVRIIKLTSSLPKSNAGKHIAGQILRSGTSPAPNYGEARGAESSADFVHKLGVVLKELNETSIWLRIIGRSQILRRELLTGIVNENLELCKIIATSLRTARIRRK
jgi:four helix bundle protein